MSTDGVSPVSIEDELKSSYLDYAMSVIVGRALPDVRDGLKPVHRRVLFAMHELSNDWNKPHKKSARVVGDVIGKYHPHGDQAVYDTIVRLAQPFSMRHMLIDGQGNFGSVDGDNAAAMRYTEVRMAKITHTMLADLEKETVDFVPNYDGSEMAPVVLPTRVPNLLVNGSAGIAVGMATNIPPHNLGEVIDACVALIDNPAIDLAGLMEHIKGPDFPTAGIINGRSGIIEAYRKGRGRIYTRARTIIETDGKSNKQTIIVNELPYQVNKARLIEKIAFLVKQKKLEGISALRDESDKQGMRIVIELKRGEVADVVLNNLYAHTAMQSVFGINMVALVENQPRTLTLKEILQAFLQHRRDVVTRRSIFDLRKARARAHVLEGLAVALANIDAVIALIKAAKTPQEAREALLAQRFAPGGVAKLLEGTDYTQVRPQDLTDDYGLINDTYRLSQAQVQAILDLRLHRLTGLEQEKLIEEFKQMVNRIRELLEILASPERMLEVIREELYEIKNDFADERRTEIVEAQEELTLEDLISEEDVVVTMSHKGYVKYQSPDHYQAQRRGGRGKSAARMKDEDFITTLLVANTHDTLLCFSSQGKVYWLKVYQLPEASRAASGKPIVNLLPLAPNERINAILPVKSFTKDQFVFMSTAKGTVKKVSLEEFSRPRASGIIAIDLVSDDYLVDALLTTGSCDVMLFSNAGKAIRFNEDAVRPMGRVARGVRGIKLGEGQRVIGIIIAHDEENAVLIATQRGYGKRTAIEEFRPTGRGGQGVIAIQTNGRNGEVVGAISVAPDHEAMLISDGGTLVRTRVDEISLIGRNTQGVRLINLAPEESLVGIERILEEKNDV